MSKTRILLSSQSGNSGAHAYAAPNQPSPRLSPRDAMIRCASTFARWIGGAGFTWSHRGWFEGKGVSTSPGPLSISYAHVGCLKARASPGPLSLPLDVGRLTLSLWCLPAYPQEPDRAAHVHRGESRATRSSRLARWQQPAREPGPHSRGRQRTQLSVARHGPQAQRQHLRRGAPSPRPSVRT